LFPRPFIFAPKISEVSKREVKNNFLALNELFKVGLGINPQAKSEKMLKQTHPLPSLAKSEKCYQRAWVSTL